MAVGDVVCDPLVVEMLVSPIPVMTGGLFTTVTVHVLYQPNLGLQCIGKHSRCRCQVWWG